MKAFMTYKARATLAHAALLFALAVAPLCACADVKHEGPYDESADARADIATAFATAGAEGKRVLILFGANWCPDCRALGEAMQDPDVHALVDNEFVVTHVDIGRWDRNMDLVQHWLERKKPGIPSVAVANPDGTLVYATRKGEAARARRMDKAQFLEFFRLLAELP
jgi:thiol-disulfide isomerase/thioredoxin